MRFEGCSREMLFCSQKLALIILLDVGRVSKALKGEIVRFLLFFCFAMKGFNEPVMRGGISAQGVQ